MKPEERPTPESSANAFVAAREFMPSKGVLVVPIETAQRLERERDLLLAELGDAKPLLMGIESDPGEPLYRRERAKRLLRAFESAIAEVKGTK